MRPQHEAFNTPLSFNEPLDALTEHRGEMNGDMMEMLNLAMGVPNDDKSSNSSMLIAALSQISARTRSKGGSPNLELCSKGGTLVR